MLQIKTFTFGPFETNCYVVSDEQQILLIDPACYTDYEQQELERYLEKLIANSQKSIAIIATHGHLDHLWGAKWATDRWNTLVFMHEADIPLARAMQAQYNLFGIRRPAESFPIEGIQSTEHRIQTDLQIIETPGHTPGSICLYWPEEKTLISGDTLFQNGYGRTDLPGGNMGQLITSLEKLFTLPSDVRVFPGHGAPTTIGAEKR